MPYYIRKPLSSISTTNYVFDISTRYFNILFLGDTQLNIETTGGLVNNNSIYKQLYEDLTGYKYITINQIDFMADTYFYSSSIGSVFVYNTLKLLPLQFGFSVGLHNVGGFLPTSLIDNNVNLYVNHSINVNNISEKHITCNIPLPIGINNFFSAIIHLSNSFNSSYDITSELNQILLYYNVPRISLYTILFKLSFQGEIIS